MIGLTRNLLPRLMPRSLKVSSHRTKFYQVPGENFIRLVPPEDADPNLRVGPYPRTKEDYEKAAKKYNLIPEDYKPFEETDGFGDYPDLPAIGAYNRNWYDDFDDTTDHRFYNEPLHLYYDLYLWERQDPLEDKKGHWSYTKKMVCFWLIFACLPTYVYLQSHYRIYVNDPYKKRPLPWQRMAFPETYNRHDFPSV